MKTLKLAVVGAGHLGRFHAQKLAQMPGVELVAVADPVEANRNRVAAECQTQAVADYRELVGQIDAAVLAAPTRLHHAIGMELLERGVHLLAEKPIASTLEQADDLVRVARRQRVVLQVGHVERFNPALTAVLPHLREPKYIEAVRAGGFTGRSTDIGVVLDLMIHDLDLVLSLVRSPVRQVEALGISVLGQHEDAASARIVFENGCVATLNASRVSYQASRTMQVWTSGGFAALDFSTRTATLVQPAEALQSRCLQVDTLPAEGLTEVKEQLFTTLLPRQQFQPEPVDAITAELIDFTDSIRQGRAPRVSGEQARDALALAEQILHEIDAHQWDGHAAGRIGPHAVPRPSVIPAPHFDRAAAEIPLREAG
jgi:predicted dehydrogenase